MKRREFLLGLGLVTLGTPPLMRASSPSGLYLSAASDAEGRHFVVALKTDGSIHFQTRIPERAHAVVSRPWNHEIVAVARRPGRILSIIDARNGKFVHQVESPDERHWYGHAVFSHDSRLLYVTENDLAGERGSIAVLDAERDYERIRTLDSGGIGPHELLMLPSGKLFICNGGILTHPDTGRTALNLDAMRPNICIMSDSESDQRQVHELAPRWHLSSIRHATTLADGKVALVMQNQADSRGRAPLFAIYRPGVGLTPYWAPRRTQIGLKDYCGSVRTDRSGQLIAVSSPRGNRICIWDDKGRFLDETRITDACGLVSTQHAGEWLVTDGRGNIHHIKLQAAVITKTHQGNLTDLRWDNHLST